VKLGDDAVRDAVVWDSPLRRPCSWESTPSEMSSSGIRRFAARAAGKRRRTNLDVTGNVDSG